MLRKNAYLPNVLFIIMMNKIIIQAFEPAKLYKINTLKALILINYKYLQMPPLGVKII